MSNPKTAYDSVVAAKYMLALANRLGQNLNATKLQKLLFITYGYVLAIEGYNVFTESPKAWPFGPVFPRVQKQVKLDRVIKLENPELTEIQKDEFLTKLMEDVITKYAKFSATQLSEWSHESGSPWHQTTQEKGFDWNRPIKDEYIIDYFTKFNVR
jgi:uncharacterized phage-associated protein